MLLTTTSSERIGRCTRMRRFFVRSNRSESFVRTRSSAGFTIITSGFEFSVHTGAPRIHGELLKLGFVVAQSSVAKYMVKRRGPPSQGWRTFLHNHAPDIAAMDLFVVPTIGFDLLLLSSSSGSVAEILSGSMSQHIRPPIGSRDESRRHSPGTRLRAT